MWAGSGILGLANPLGRLADIPLPQPARNVIDTLLPAHARGRIDTAKVEFTVVATEKTKRNSVIHSENVTTAPQIDLAGKSGKKPDPFETVRARADLTPKKIAALFNPREKSRTARLTERPRTAQAMPVTARFAAQPHPARLSGDAAMLAFAAPGHEQKAVTAFSALLSQDDDDDLLALPQDETASLYDETPDDTPLPQLRPQGRKAVTDEKPDSTGRADEAKPAPRQKDKPQALAYARPERQQVERGTGTLGQSLRGMFGGNGGGTAIAHKGVAVYDISAAKVYMPDGSVLEAHSGIGKMADNPRYAHVKMNGPTPPHVYNLRMRERRFHGVEAIRMLPADGKNKHGRDGFLTHSYLLRGRIGQSHGCVAFKDYDRFLNAFKQGKIRQLVVVASGGRSAGIKMAAKY